MNTALIDTLRCPVSGGKLELAQDGSELISHEAQLAYPIRDGIPVLLAAEARPLQTPQS